LDIAITVLGDFSVYRDKAAISLPQSRKTRALLAYLAVLGKPQRRERLCELFWDVPDDPRGALRWSLSKLRQILNADGEERLQADRNFAHLKPGTFVLDYELIRGLSSESIGGLTTERLGEIAAAFTGPFLVDLYLPHCSAFEAWRVYCSNEIEILHLKTLRTLIDRLGDEPERALAYVHTLQTLLPDEDFAKEITGINDRARQTAATRSVTEALSASLTGSAVRLAGEAAVGLPSGNWPAVRSPAIGARKQSICYAHSNDGTRIAYAVSGSGPAIVRASHWMSHLDFDWESPVWGHWIDALSDGFTLLRYDGRLNGLSDTTAQDTSLDAFIADLECVVDAAGFRQFVLLGISQGCALSVEFAARHPERVAGLLLYGGYVRGWRARGDANEIGRREAIVALIRQGWGQDDPIFRQLFTNLFIPGANRVQMDWFNELQRRTLTPENAWRLSNAFADIDVSARLNELHLPTLVLHARGDRVAPLSGGLALSGAIPGARFVELDSFNHILLAEEPAFQEFVREATGFANQVFETKAIVPIDKRTRRHATILCAVFVSPVQATEEFSPETALEIIDSLLLKAVELVRANGGTVLSVTDSELIASFGAPDAQEGHAALACRTALKLRETALNEPQPMTRVRIAMDTGVVIVGQARVVGAGALEVRGGPVTVANALSQALRRDLVAATERTHTSAGGFVSMKPLRSRTVSDFSKDQRLYEVLEINRGRSRWQLRSQRRLSPFIGREMPLQILNKAWRDANGGEGQTVIVVGAPGLGKSRVTHEFVGAIPQDEAEHLEAGALETDLQNGYVVIRKVLQGLFGVDESEAPSAAVEKVLVGQSDRRFDKRLLDPIMAVMELPAQDPIWAGIPAKERSRRMQEAVVALLLFLANTKPLVLLVEDLHWIDLESEAILVRLAEAASTGRILFILTCRPEYDRSAFATASPVEIRLSALNAAETGELLDYLLGKDPQLDRLRADLAEVCKGNALFLEETVRALAETGKLQGEPGRYYLSGEVGEIIVSASIHSIIDARFERLEADAKRVAEVASIFGGEIPAVLLRKLAALPGTRFDAALQILKKADLLVEVQVFPEISLRFKHALIRNSISERIVSSARVDLHRAALAELRAYYVDRIEEHAERLARHAQAAHLWEEAATYLLMSAWKAIRRSAHASALAHLDLGIRLLKGNRDIADAERREIEFQLARGVALMAARGWGSTEVLAAFERAEELCERTGDQSRLFTTLRGRAQYYMISGKPAAAQELACRCAELIEGRSDPGLEIETDHMFWTNNFFLGQVSDALRHAERAIGRYDPDRDHHLTYLYSGHDPGVCSRSVAGLSAWLSGDPVTARLRCNQSIELAGRFEHPLTTALAYWGLSYLHMFASEPEHALEAAERELQISREFQLPLLTGQAVFQIGWARFSLGEREAGLRQMDDAITAIRGTGAEMGLPYFIGLYAESAALAGRLDEAEKSIAAALEIGRHNGSYFQLPEVLKIEAGIRSRRGISPVETEKILYRANDVAAAQHSVMGQLRISIELARRLRERGDGESARGLLAPHSDLIARLCDNNDGRAAREFL